MSISEQRPQSAELLRFGRVLQKTMRHALCHRAFRFCQTTAPQFPHFLNSDSRGAASVSSLSHAAARRQTTRCKLQDAYHQYGQSRGVYAALSFSLACFFDVCCYCLVPAALHRNVVIVFWAPSKELQAVVSCGNEAPLTEEPSQSIAQPLLVRPLAGRLQPFTHKCKTPRPGASARSHRTSKPDQTLRHSNFSADQRHLQCKVA